MFTIRWSRKSLKQLLHFPLKDRKNISAAVDDLSSWPECGNVIHLKNHAYPYRLRVGRYRVFFEVDKTIRVVSIEEVKKRDERTY